MITVTGLRWVPPVAQGKVKDLRVRWALEEAGLPYEVKLVSPEDRETPGYLSEQPFGQVPVYQEDGLVLFESGAIVQHIAERSDALMPREPAARARVASWMYAAATSVEPHIQAYTLLLGPWSGEDWAKLRKPGAEDFARRTIGRVGAWLKDRDYLEGGRFTAADLLMTAVLQITRDTGLNEEAGLGPYLERCKARPAYQRALAAQLADYAANAPPSRPS